MAAFDERLRESSDDMGRRGLVLATLMRLKQICMVHKFVCPGAIEERIDELIESKRKMAEDLLASGGEINLTELADADLMALVKLDLAAATQEGGGQ